MHPSVSCLGVWVRGRLRIHGDMFSSMISQTPELLRTRWMEKRSKMTWVCRAEGEVPKSLKGSGLAPLESG